MVSAKASRRSPVMLTPREVGAMLAEMSGTTGLVASLLYGTGMRLLEALRLRGKDIEFERRELQCVTERAATTVSPCCPRT